MPMSGPAIEAAIRAAIPDASVTLTDLAGDDDHWAAHVVSPAFAGLSRIRQHRLVYEALGGQMGGALHALQLTTSVPAVQEVSS
jgi:stress-induced morphogen